jgi:hypothetical protein
MIQLTDDDALRVALPPANRLDRVLAGCDDLAAGLLRDADETAAQKARPTTRSTASR